MCFKRLWYIQVLTLSLIWFITHIFYCFNIVISCYWFLCHSHNILSNTQSYILLTLNFFHFISLWGSLDRSSIICAGPYSSEYSSSVLCNLFAINTFSVHSHNLILISYYYLLFSILLVIQSNYCISFWFFFILPYLSTEIIINMKCKNEVFKAVEGSGWAIIVSHNLCLIILFMHILFYRKLYKMLL